MARRSCGFMRCRLYRPEIEQVMKTIAIMAILGVMGTGARAEPVMVCMQNNSVVPPHVLSRAQVLADEMFASAGVEIWWHGCEPSPAQSPGGRSIRIEMYDKTPKRRMPGVLAFTLPDEREHITVYYDRVQQATQFELTPSDLLGHVLVHEITHILQGGARHSNGGVMKPTYTQKDIKAMRHGPLPLGAEDVQSIKAGLAERRGADELVSVFPGRDGRIDKQ